MTSVSDKVTEILDGRLENSLAIAEKVGAPVSDEDVSVLITFAAELLKDKAPKNGSSDSFDYRSYEQHADKDLPDFVPVKTGKGGRKPAPVRKFMMYFFPIVEYMMSSEHGRIRMRDNTERWANLTTSEEFEQLNQVGQLAVLITQLFFPKVDLKTDVRSVLQPIKGQLPYWVTRAEKDNPSIAAKYKRTDEKPGEAWLRSRPYEVEIEEIRPKLDEIRRRLRQQL